MANNLREIRQARNLPMLGLSVQAHVSTATLSAIERWGYIPKADVQRRLAEALAVSVEAIWPEGATSAIRAHASAQGG